MGGSRSGSLQSCSPFGGPTVESVARASRAVGVEDTDMLTDHTARLSAALNALAAFQGDDGYETGDYDRGAELELYETVQDCALVLLDYLRDVGAAKRSVRRIRPYAVAAPAEVRESCPPSVRTWRIVDLETGRAEPMMGEAQPTEDQAWLSCRAALGVGN